MDIKYPFQNLNGLPTTISIVQVLVLITVDTNALLLFAKREDNEKLNGKLSLYHGAFYPLYLNFVFKKSTIFQMSAVLIYVHPVFHNGYRLQVCSIINPWTLNG